MTAQQAPSAAPAVRSRVLRPPADGLRRSRLLEPFFAEPFCQLGLVVAPAGCGKTTLLTHLAEGTAYPVAWLSLDTLAGDIASLLAHLRLALVDAVPGLAPTWANPEAALVDLDAKVDRPVLLVLDDLHALHGEPAADAIRLLLEQPPGRLRLLVGSRTAPAADLERSRLAGRLWELDADDLRFRTWEVDQLYRGPYAMRLSSTELPVLTRGTEGWAAGLRMFHLATRDQPASERARVLAGLGRGSRLARRYLTLHVLDTVTVELRDFLLRTSVLDELTGPRCDRLLNRRSSATLLNELERRGLFTFLRDDGHTYRYHDVLRAYLLDILSTELGAAVAVGLHRRAGELLEDEDALPEALRAYSRGSDWAAVRRLLGRNGPSLARDPGSWLDLLPDAIRENDPWVLLAVARRMLAHGSLEQAHVAYARALEALPAGTTSEALVEYRALDGWLSPRPGRVLDAVHLVRAALRDVSVRQEDLAAAGPGALLPQALAHLIAGDLPQAGERLAVAAGKPDQSPLHEFAVLLLSGWRAALAGEPTDEVLRRTRNAAMFLHSPALLRLAEALAIFAGGAEGVPVEHLLASCRRDGDRWGEATVLLFGGLGLLGTTAEAGDWLTRAEQLLTDLGATALARWATSGRALVLARADPAMNEKQVLRAGAAGRAGQPLPHALALLARGVAEGGEAGEQWTRTARELAARCGGAAFLARYLPAGEPGPVRLGGGTADREPARLTVTCLGGFTLAIDGHEIDLAGARPQVLDLLRILAVHAGSPVRREHLLAYVWPDREPARAAHSLQVAISELRKLLGTSTSRGANDVLRREAGGYRLILASPADSDLHALEELSREATRAERSDQPEAAATLHERVVAAFTGDVLGPDSPDEWGLECRDRVRQVVARSCAKLAAYRSLAGAHQSAAEAARRGVHVAPYSDELWRRLRDSEEAAGNTLAAQAAGAEYARMLRELGAVEALPDSLLPRASARTKR